MTHPPLSIDDLEAKARAATPGPWREHSYAAEVCSDDADAIATCNIDHNRLTGGTAQQHADASFIAAANPRTVLALVDEIKTLRSEAERDERILSAAAKRVRELEAGLREALYRWRIHLDGPAGTPESAQPEWDRETAIRALLHGEGKP